MIFKKVKRFFFPEDFGCVLCGRRGEPWGSLGGAVICSQCKAHFPPAGPHVCSCCGRPVGSKDSLCRFCAADLSGFDRAVSVFDYRENVRSFVFDIKYHDQPWLTKYAGRAMAEKLYQSGESVDVVTYVPIHFKKKRKRGFDQAQLMAQNMAYCMGLPCETLLSRTRNTAPQSGLSAEERRENIRGAFQILPEKLDLIRDRCVAVVDDVMTTGSSLAEIARVLHENGARRVIGVCFAAVGEPDPAQEQTER